MDNIILLKRSPELEKLSQELGFTKTFFLEDLSFVEEKDKKLLFKKISEGKKQKKLVICRALNEEQLRLILEKTDADIILGMEQIHSEDSLHYLRGGLDQILCTIAAERGKILAFSFAEILNSKNRPQLLGRMRFNLWLCKKFKVKTFLGNFSQEKMEMRSKKDLENWERLLKR